MLKSKPKILIKMTGSIACFKACALISKLAQSGYELRVVTSPSALKFIGAATIEGLTGSKVISDLWEPGEAMAHIHLMRWADLIVVVPASANFINRVARGLGEDLLTTLFLAHDFKKPYLIAPAMNTSMYLHPVTQKSLKELTEMGIEILESASGVLACGEFGFGRLLEPDLLAKEIENRLAQQVNTPSDQITSTAPSKLAPVDHRAKKILITSGGTQEKIDDVRVISNTSTGRTGAQLADLLENLGFETVLVHSKSAVLPQNSSELISFETSVDIESALRNRLTLGDIGAVLHLAAISDFVPTPVSGKISSATEVLDLKLIRNKKILPLIQKMSPSPLFLTAFKLTSTPSNDVRKEAVERIFEQASPHLVVQNDLTEITQVGKHLFHVYSQRPTNSDDPVPEGVDLAGLAEKFVSSYLKWQKKEPRHDSHS